MKKTVIALVVVGILFGALFATTVSAQAGLFGKKRRQPIRGIINTVKTVRNIRKGQPIRAAVNAVKAAKSFQGNSLLSGVRSKVKQMKSNFWMKTGHPILAAKNAFDAARLNKKNGMLSGGLVKKVIGAALIFSTVKKFSPFGGGPLRKLAKLGAIAVVANAMRPKIGRKLLVGALLLNAVRPKLGRKLLVGALLLNAMRPKLLRKLLLFGVVAAAAAVAGALAAKAMMAAQQQQQGTGGAGGGAVGEEATGTATIHVTVIGEQNSGIPIQIIGQRVVSLETQQENSYSSGTRSTLQYSRTKEGPLGTRTTNVEMTKTTGCSDGNCGTKSEAENTMESFEYTVYTDDSGVASLEDINVGYASAIIAIVNTTDLKAQLGTEDEPLILVPGDVQYLSIAGAASIQLSVPVEINDTEDEEVNLVAIVKPSNGEILADDEGNAWIQHEYEINVNSEDGEPLQCVSYISGVYEVIPIQESGTYEVNLKVPIDYTEEEYTVQLALYVGDELVMSNEIPVGPQGTIEVDLMTTCSLNEI
jgi:hypothetical protein